MKAVSQERDSIISWARHIKKKSPKLDRISGIGRKQVDGDIPFLIRKGNRKEPLSLNFILKRLS
jgi:hypothetical protein